MCCVDPVSLIRLECPVSECALSASDYRVCQFLAPAVPAQCMGACMSHLVIIRRIAVAGHLGDSGANTPRIKLGRGRNCHVRCACSMGATKASQAKNCPRRLTRSHQQSSAHVVGRAKISQLLLSLLSTTSLKLAQHTPNQALRLPGSLHHPHRSSKALSMLWTERTSDE